MNICNVIRLAAGYAINRYSGDTAFVVIPDGDDRCREIEAYLASLTPEERAKALIDEPVPPELTSEQKAAAIRAQRNALLSACDWTQLPDSPVQAEAGWYAYRQALRDITDQATFPDSVKWPVKPA